MIRSFIATYFLLHSQTMLSSVLTLILVLYLSHYFLQTKFTAHFNLVLVFCFGTRLSLEVILLFIRYFFPLFDVNFKFNSFYDLDYFEFFMLRSVQTITVSSFSSLLLTFLEKYFPLNKKVTIENETFQHQNAAKLSYYFVLLFFVVFSLLLLF